MMAGKKRSISTDADGCTFHKELDGALCPICMDHPHNAVLLMCTSYGKGCRAYICDTSYRHSNCLDRFRKLKPESSNHPSPTQRGTSDLSTRNSSLLFRSESVQDDTAASKSRLKCPMCRGDVVGWKVLEEARRYLNLKPRSCTRESCLFVGNYYELRRHARSVHPTVRPAEIDPSRQQAWRCLENQREYDDIVSAIRSAMPGAIVLGDYVVDYPDRPSGDRRGPWAPALLLFEMLDSVNPVAEPQSRYRPWTRHRRSGGGGGAASSGRRYLWGENLLGLQDDSTHDEDDPNPFNDAREDTPSPIPRRRRRLSH